MTIHVHPDWWKTLFDEVYLLTDARSVCDEELTRREVDFICEILPIEREHRILDLCGGHGRHSFEFYARGFIHCTLVDYSEFLIEHAMTHAAERNCSVHIVHADARFTGLAGASFDRVIIMGNSLGYISDSNADRQILNEAYRLLRPGGWILADLSDGKAMKECFVPISWHEIGDDIVVCRQRELVMDAIHAREMVLDKKKGLVRDRTYAVRLYDAAAFRKILAESFFKNICIHTGFSPHSRKGDFGFMNRRMIAIGKKG